MNKINLSVVDKKVAERKNRIETYAQAAKVPFFVAAMYIDERAPYTTNKAMLKEIGLSIDVVTEENVSQVLMGLEAINIKVVGTETVTKQKLAQIMNDVLNDEIPECWGGPDCQEYVDITPIAPNA
jgi:hypothetical protein